MMALNHNSIHSEVESHNISCCDYRPKKNNPMLHQKEDWSKEVFCDTVPDFSVISEAASDYNSEKHKRSSRGIKLKKIPVVMNSKPISPYRVPLSSGETSSDSESEQYHETDVKHLMRPANRQAFQVNLISPKQCDRNTGIKTNTIHKNCNDSFFLKTNLVGQSKINQDNVYLNAVHIPLENCSSEKSLSCENCEQNGISIKNANNTNEVVQSANIEDGNVQSSTCALSNTGSLSENKTLHDPLPDNIRECMIEKDKQIETMQMEISKLIEQNKHMNEVLKNVQENAQRQGSPARTPLSESNRDVNDLNQTLIRYLEDRDKHMHKLQDQVDFLIQRTKELESYYLSNQRLAFSPASNSPDEDYKENFPRTNTSFDFLNQNHATKNKEKSYQEQRQTQKTSTSTMTSLIFDGSDRMVFQKTTTLVTDYTNSKKDVSTPSPIDNIQMKSKNKYSPRNGNELKLSKKCQRPNCKCKVQKEAFKNNKLNLPYTNGAANFNADENIVKNPRRTKESPYGAEKDKENINEVELLSTPERPHFPKTVKNVQYHENVDPEPPLRRKYTKSFNKKPKSHKVRKSPLQNDALQNTIPKEIFINQLDSEEEDWHHMLDSDDLYNLKPRNTPHLKQFDKKAHRSQKKHQRSPFDTMHQNGRNSSMSSASISSSLESLQASSPYQGNIEPEDFSPRKLDICPSQFGLTSPDLSQETVRYLAEYGLRKERSPPFEGRTRLSSDRHDTRLPCHTGHARLPSDRRDTKLLHDRMLR